VGEHAVGEHADAVVADLGAHRGWNGRPEIWIDRPGFLGARVTGFIWPYTENRRYHIKKKKPTLPSQIWIPML
jgi:hypothetical protein